MHRYDFLRIWYDFTHVYTLRSVHTFDDIVALRMQHRTYKINVCICFDCMHLQLIFSVSCQQDAHFETQLTGKSEIKRLNACQVKKRISLNNSEMNSCE